MRLGRGHSRTRSWATIWVATSVWSGSTRALDWERIAAIVADLHSSREGRKAYPPLLMFKALLLQHLHDASDPKLEERLSNDLSWRRFVGLGLTDGTPDHATISRFRSLMVEKGLMRRVFRRGERPAGREGDVRARRHGGGRDAGPGAGAPSPVRAVPGTGRTMTGAVSRTRSTPTPTGAAAGATDTRGISPSTTVRGSCGTRW